MTQRRSMLGVCLLVLILLASGLAGCKATPKPREEEPTQVAETPAAAEPSQASATAPVPGETVVSAVTPPGETPVAGEQPTVVSIGETPGAPLGPQATAMPAASPQATSASAPPPPASQGEVIYHTVQPGESLSSIARRYGTSWQAIAQANGLVNPDQIYAGQKLTIPTSSSGGSSGGTTGCRIRHAVQQGEWVWQIARHYGVSPYDILASNGLTIQTANTIYPGAVLCIP